MENSTEPTITATRIMLISFLIALGGVSLSVWGASWDITSHLLRTPETFFTPSHLVLYSGVAISLISAAIIAVLLVLKKGIREESFSFGSRLVIVGSMFQIIAGPGDFYWHEMFGIDGLLSPTHILLALGILIVSVGVLIGLGRIRGVSRKEKKFTEMIIPVSFGIFWFNMMWLIFFFVLPISEGETHNFNPDPFVAIALSLIALPFSFSVIFWIIAKNRNAFGAASISALVFVIMNVTANILTTENLLSYLPWFALPIAGAISADYILNRKITASVVFKNHEKIAGAILGSMFFMFCFPMLGMTFLEIYTFNDVFAYDLIPTAQNEIFEIWLMTSIPGAISGMIGMAFASRKISHRMQNVGIKD